MATFVLIHGAWHGGWCWARVAPLLRAAGHAVYAPTLTGLGERSHLLTPAVNLDTHARDVANVLEFEDLEATVLVGHSYGGLVVSAAAELVPERIARLVYLDAFVANDGECLMDLFPPGAGAATLARAEAEGDGWRSPPLDERVPFGVRDPADAAWVRGKLTDHPVATWLQPVRLTSPAAGALPRAFIECTGTGWFGKFAERARAAGWQYTALLTGHDAMITAPKELARRLVDLANQACGLSGEH